MHKVSVIMPLYNVADVVQASLHALECQTLDDVEVVFVDDGSSDRSVAIVSEWMERQTNKGLHCKLIRHKENQGVACARNSGLENATGEYIYYLDSDDSIEPETLAAMYDYARRGNYDAVWSEWFYAVGDKGKVMPQPDAETGIEAFEKLCKGSLRCNLWLFLVRRDIYEKDNIRFIPGKNMGEDLGVMLKIMISAVRVAAIHKPYYRYNQTNSGSISRSYSGYYDALNANIRSAEKFLIDRGYVDRLPYIYMLELTVKLPLLISSSTEDYKNWERWFPGSEKYINANDEIPFRTRLIQLAAARRQYWFLKLYHLLVVRCLYKLILK